MRDVEIVGVGMTRFGKQEDRSLESLGRAAVVDALNDGGVTSNSIQAAFVANVLGGGQVGQRVLFRAGIESIPVLTIDVACASGSAALHEGFEAVASGRHDIVLVLGVEKMSGLFKGGINLQREDRESRLGLTMPGIYAMVARRHMFDFGTTPAQLAAVSVKNRRHGLANPRAMFAQEVSVEQVLESPAIADPLTMLQCCPNADGAAAVVLTAGDHGRAGRPRVRVLASHLVSGTSLRRQVEIDRGDISRRAAAGAYEQAGVGPADVDVAEVHDPFTIGEVVSTEALGFCDAGDGGDFAASGASSLDGSLPVNPSGGLMSKGHPVAATGVAQIAELTWQLRGEAEGRQVPEARVAVAHTVGGGVAELDGVASVVSILAAA